jgi:hypothetical protein
MTDSLMSLIAITSLIPDSDVHIPSSVATSDFAKGTVLQTLDLHVTEATTVTIRKLKF